MSSTGSILAAVGTGNIADVNTSTTDSAGTQALQAAQLSRQVVTDMMSQTVPFQGDMSQIVQNRPQPILPQPTLNKPLQPSDPNQGKVTATTAQGQQRNDLMDLFHSVGSIVTQGINQKREQENNQMMADLAIIQAAASNPTDPHNKAILDKMAKDPKTVKRLQKALGYNPLSGEPMPPETKTMVQFGAQQKQKQERAKALQGALQDRLGMGSAQLPTGDHHEHWRDGLTPQNAMEALMSRAPNVPQVNPVVQIQGELIKAGIMPKADTSLKAFMTFTKDLMTNQQKYDEFKAKAEAYNNRTMQMYLKNVDDARNKLELERLRQGGAKERSGIRAGAEVESAKIRAKATVDAAKLRQQNSVKLAEMRSKHQLLVKETDQLDKDIKNAQVDRAAAQQAKDKNKQESVDKELQRLNLLKGKNEELMKMYDTQEGALSQSLTVTSATDELLNESGGSDEDEMDKEDRIF